MIYKDSNIDFYNILNQANNNLKETKESINIIKDDLEEKIKLIKLKQDYEQYLNTITSNNVFKEYEFNKLFCQDLNISGDYITYGSCIHPSFITNPDNIFNFINHNEVGFFRKDVFVKINNVYEEYNNNILKHDSISDKKVFYKEFNSKNITLEIGIDKNNPLGRTVFNTIEFDPYLEGSFSIDNLTIYPRNSTNSEDIITINNIKNITKERYILKEKVDFEKITMDISLNYSININNEYIYPFVLNHIYFYNANYKNNSKIYTKLSCDKNISYVKDNAILKTQDGEEDISLTDEEIKLYADYVNGEYNFEIYPSYDNNIFQIPKITKDVFINMPLKIKSYKLLSLNIKTS